jgi:hypothetical protein
VYDRTDPGIDEAAWMAEDEELETQRLRGTRQQSLGRRINDRIFALREDAVSSAYICECALKWCNADVTLSVAEYLEVRSSPTYFLIACGHWSPGVERIVYRADRYLVVEKLGHGGLLASRSGDDHTRRDPPHGWN